MRENILKRFGRVERGKYNELVMNSSELFVDESRVRPKKKRLEVIDDGMEVLWSRYIKKWLWIGRC